MNHQQCKKPLQQQDLLPLQSGLHCFYQKRGLYQDKADSTCSKSVVSLVGELIDIVSDGEIAINDIGFYFYKKTTKNGNNCVVADLI